MKKLMVLMSVLALTLFAGRAFAADMNGMKMDKKSASGKAMNYEVVDVACYVAKGAKGEKHKDCAVKCIGGGGELALLHNGKLYIPVDENFHSARAQFVSRAGETVEVTGKVVSKSGVNYLKVSGKEKKDSM
jgi:hypothetical protein